MRIALLAVVLMSRVAGADAGKPEVAAHQLVESAFVGNGYFAMRFAFEPEGTRVDIDATEPGGSPYETDVQKVVTAIAAGDKSTAWVAFDLRTFPDCDVFEKCKAKKPFEVMHAAVLIEIHKSIWWPIAWHLAKPLTAKGYAALIKSGKKLDAIARKIDKGAEDAVKQFESTIGDPAALAKTVSARKDVVLYGSAAAERYVGGGAVKAQFAKWGLALKVRDGIQAGISEGKTVAWVAANVDAVPAKKPKAAPSPYRAFFIYEKGAAGWELVQASFSFSVNPYADPP